MSFACVKPFVATNVEFEDWLVRANARQGQASLSDRILTEIPRLRIYARLMTNDVSSADRRVRRNAEAQSLRYRSASHMQRLANPPFHDPQGEIGERSELPQGVKRAIFHLGEICGLRDESGFGSLAAHICSGRDFRLSTLSRWMGQARHDRRPGQMRGPPVAGRAFARASTIGASYSAAS